MVYGSRGPKTPASFHIMFSFGIGALEPICVHSHKVITLVALNLLWLALHLFMHARARRARGVFIDEEIELYTWPGAAGFFGGLLLATIALLFIG